MASELPYFKFMASEWISGGITLESLETQGAFINICAYYWFKSGTLTLTEIKRRLKLKQAIITELIDGNHIKVTDDSIEITFLREQFDDRGMISKRNSENGSKGGAPKGNKNAEKNNRKQPKTSNIEEEKRREEKNIKILGSDKKQPMVKVKRKYIHESSYLIYGEEGYQQYMEEDQLTIPANELPWLKKFLVEKNGSIYDSKSYLINSFKNYINNQFK